MFSSDELKKYARTLWWGLTTARTKPYAPGDLILLRFDQAATPLAEAVYDLLITDLNMPRISGLQLAEELRPVRPDLPIVLITGFSKAIPPDRLDSLGAVWLLPKPFSTGELALAVRQALDPVAGGSDDPTYTGG